MNAQKIRYQVTNTLLFGLLAFSTRAFNLITPLGGVFVLDLRDFFVAIGAAIGGPIPGLIIGILAGLPAAIPTIDIISFSIAGFTVGCCSTYLYKKKMNVAYSAAFMLFGYAAALVLVFLFDLWPASIFLIARAAICTPINIFILNNLISAYPNILASSRYS